MAGKYDVALNSLAPGDFFDPIYREVFKQGLQLVSEGVSERNRIAGIVDAISRYDAGDALVMAGELAGWQHYGFGELDYHIKKIRLTANARRIYCAAVS